jgi:hypothetical protein
MTDARYRELSSRAIQKALKKSFVDAKGRTFASEEGKSPFEGRDL